MSSLGVRKLLLHRPDEPIDEVDVDLTGDALVAPAGGVGIAESFSVVRPDAQHDRQRSLWPNPADQPVG
jgi:hypothetical protein